MHMENQLKEVEILDIEEMSEENFYQLSQELIADNIISRNMDLEFNELLMK